MSPGGPTILLSAGEPSGDLHGATLAAALRRRWPDVRMFGLGGRRMAAEGVELLAPPERLAVMGFIEVARHLPFFLRLMKRVANSMVERDTDLVIPIDYPGFNMRLARRAQAAGVPVLYYIAPQVWAWHRQRMAELAASADRLAVVFPFEEPLFQSAGANVRFVGHPLTDRRPAVPDRSAFADELGVPANAPILALFPGSRAQEVKRHLRRFAGAAAEVHRRRPDVHAVVAAAPTVAPAAYAQVGLPITTDSLALLTHATAALVKSGTTTVEASLTGTPMVVAYRAHPLTFWLARRLVRVEHVGMVNLIANRRVAPEFLQRRATPAALAEALLPLLDTTSPEREAMLHSLAEVRAALGGEGESGVADMVADMAAELLPDHA